MELVLVRFLVSLRLTVGVAACLGLVASEVGFCALGQGAFLRMITMLDARKHDHNHAPNRFAVIPTPERLDHLEEYGGKGVTIAFLDSGFHPHSDLITPINRIVAFADVTGETEKIDDAPSASWQWHGTQTTVVAAGSGHLSEGAYRGLAHEAHLALIKVGINGRITEDNIARGIEWVIANRDRYDIRVLNISLGGDEDVPCSKSVIDQLAEEVVQLGIVVVVAAGNSDSNHSIPPANSPSVITVGGYSDRNQLARNELDLYHSNFGATVDGTVKPEIIAPAMFVSAPILPGTTEYKLAEALSHLASAPDYQLPDLAKELQARSILPKEISLTSADAIRDYVELALRQNKIVAAHYQHVDGTSFAAPIVSSIVAQMIQANPKLTPGAVKSILISTAERIGSAPSLRQGYGVVNARQAVAAALREQHALNVSGCKPPRVENGRLVFAFHDDVAQTVSVAGDFNDWNATKNPLRKNDTGLWVVTLPAPTAGEYQYKFVIDGHRWLEDPSNGMKVPDKFGGLNSVIIII